MTAVSPAIVAAAALLAGGAVLAFGRSPWTAPATGPWAVAGGAIVVAGRAGVYDSLVPPPSAAILLASVGALAAAVWVGAGHLADDVEDYAMDLHVFEGALGGTADDADAMVSAFEDAYRAAGDRVIEQLREIEGRGRYQ